MGRSFTAILLCAAVTLGTIVLVQNTVGLDKLKFR